MSALCNVHMHCFTYISLFLYGVGVYVAVAYVCGGLVGGEAALTSYANVLYTL